MQKTSATVAFGREGGEGKVGRETLKIGKDCRKVCAPGFFHKWERACFSLPRRIEKVTPKVALLIAKGMRTKLLT
jgi:hypothetical protein